MSSTVVSTIGSGSRRVAAIDIGTNSIHLVVAEVHENGHFDVIAQEKEMVRLGVGPSDSSILDPRAMDRAVEVLRRMRQVAEVSGAELAAVATSATREASNQALFLERCATEAGVKVDVIPGTEEARLIHLGVVQSLAVGDRRILVLDIGGGSTEFVVGRGAQPEFMRSLPLGSLRLTEKFFPGGRTSPDAVLDLRRHVRSFISDVHREIETLDIDFAAGSSGTIEAIGRVVEGMRGVSPASRMNGFRFTAGELSDATRILVEHEQPADRLEIVGVEERRCDIIAAGAVLLDQIVIELNIEEIVVSEYALREGVILDQARPSGEGLHHLDDLRRSAVQHVAASFEPDRTHADHLTELALSIFDQTSRLHGLDERSLDYLEAAGLLCNIGRFVSHSAHHKHSYYMIRNSDRLVGFTSREIELIALISRYHRKSTPKMRHPEYAALDASARQQVSILAGILRIAIGLDRSHAANVSSTVCHVDDKKRRLSIKAVVADGIDASLDIYTANSRSALLAGALEAKVTVTA